ncbi:MAG: segregation/condensation protein A [Candidatus Pacebacteria bacterium]|nr:segregation/condensation protein A [Candidatus Paceibacterota bacterium]
MSQTFNVNLERFSGPYFKLLELIEDRKLSINEFSLSQITDEYILYIKELESKNEKDIVDISQFISIASTLMLIKAKSLFPNIEYTEDEKREVGNLEKKLELYKIMTSATKNIGKNYDKKPIFPISKFENKEVVFVFDERLDLLLMHSIAIASILKIPRKERLKQVAVRQVLKIEDVIENLLDRVQQSFKNLSFKEFSSSLSNVGKSLEERKSAFIVSFLAMLELIKNGILNAEQGEGHNEIEINEINSTILKEE